jgi:hypothetical protein
MFSFSDNVGSDEDVILQLASTQCVQSKVCPLLRRTHPETVYPAYSQVIVHVPYFSKRPSTLLIAK